MRVLEENANFRKFLVASSAKSARASLVFNGAQLFNVLPKPLRDMSGVSLDSFKRALDQFLNTVPDEPQIPGYTAYRRADSNSIIDIQILIL